MRTARALAVLVGMALVLLPACSAPSLPTRGSSTEQTTESPGVHLLMDGDKFVVALDARTGHVIWRHQLASAANAQVKPGSVGQPPFVSGHLAFVTYTLLDRQTGDEHGTLDALDLASGQLRWRHEIGSDPLSHVIVGSTIYLSHGVPGSGAVEALDLTSGRLLWSRPIPGQLAVGADKVFVIQGFGSSFDSHAFALKASDGSLLWDYTSPAMLAGPVIGNQLVYLNAQNPVTRNGSTGNLLALNTDDGKVAWQHPLTNGDYPPPLGRSGDIFCLRDLGFGVDGSVLRDMTVGLDAKTGQTRWSVPTDGATGPCVAGRDTFYISKVETGGAWSSVFALDSNDGHQLWHSHTSDSLERGTDSTPWVAHGLVGQVLATRDNTYRRVVVVYRADSGALVWQHEFRPYLVSESRQDIEGDQIYFTTVSIGDLHVETTNVLTAFSLSTGAQLWTYEIGHL